MTASIAAPVHSVVLYNPACFPREGPVKRPQAKADWCDHRPLRMTETCPVFHDPFGGPPSK